MRRILLLLLIAFNLTAYAQDQTVKKLQSDASKDIKKEKDTSGKIWKVGGTYGLNITQGSLSNWAAGGDDFSLAVNTLLNLYAFYKKDKNSWDNTFEYGFGYFKTTSLGSRKNDDHLDLLSKYDHAISSKWNVSGLFNLRSQFFKGFTYNGNQEIFSSAFFAPGYVLLSAGLDYKPSQAFSFFVSPLTLRWVIVAQDSLAAKGLYAAPGEHHHTEIGAFLSTTLVKELTKTLTYKGRLDLFSNYKQNPQNIDLYFTNLFALKISKVLSATWNVDMIYDDDVRLFGPNHDAPRLQVKSLIGVGLLVKF